MSGSVAVIGVGAMGGPMASRLHAAGFDTIVCDRDDDALSRFGEAGLETVREPSRCARAGVVLVLVATPHQVRDVLTGGSGVASGVDAARPPVVVVMSTVPAETVVELHEELRPRGVRVLDAPVSGGVVRAEQGTLSVMAGGDAEDLEAIRPVLSAVASQVFHCGPVGSGATLKIVNNIIGIASAMVTAEACRIALERGLDLQDTVRVLEASSGRTYLTADPGEAAALYSKITTTRPAFDSLAAIMRKDLGLAVDLAGQVPGSYPLVERLKEFAEAMGDETFQNWQRVGAAHPGTHAAAP